MIHNVVSYKYNSVSSTNLNLFKGCLKKTNINNLPNATTKKFNKKPWIHLGWIHPSLKAAPKRLDPQAVFRAALFIQVDRKVGAIFCNPGKITMEAPKNHQIIKSSHVFWRFLVVILRNSEGDFLDVIPWIP